jgi:hypothetical protein
VLHNRDYIVRDQQGYGMAKEKYLRNVRRLSHLQDKKLLVKRAQEKGLRTAFGISLLILFGVCFGLLTQFTRH